MNSAAFIGDEKYLRVIPHVCIHTVNPCSPTCDNSSQRHFKFTYCIVACCFRACIFGGTCCINISTSHAAFTKFQNVVRHPSTPVCIPGNFNWKFIVQNEYLNQESGLAIFLARCAWCSCNFHSGTILVHATFRIVIHFFVSTIKVSCNDERKNKKIKKSCNLL